MNREARSAERYSHCLCLHVKPASLFIGIYFFITSVSTIIKISSGYSTRNEDDTRRVMVDRPTATLLLMVHLMNAVVSAMLIYGVTKSKASYLMPFFGIQLYHFLFSLPSSMSQLNLSTGQYNRNHFGNSPITSPTEAGRTILRPGDSDNTTYTFSVLLTLGDFLIDIYFICVVWKCYRYLKMKELASTLNMPYNLDLEIVVPSDVVSSGTVAPPDYETAIKANPPPDYESAIKYQSQYPIPNTTPSINNPVIVTSDGGVYGTGSGGVGNDISCEFNQLAPPIFSGNLVSQQSKSSCQNSDSHSPSGQDQSSPPLPPLQSQSQSQSQTQSPTSESHPVTTQDSNAK